MSKSIVRFEALENRRLLSVAAISGLVFNYHNGDGAQEAGDAGLAGVKVFIDKHGTGTFVSGDPYVTTNSKGDYTLGNLAPGKYTIGAQPLVGYQVDFPFGSHTDTLTVVGGKTYTGYNFAETTTSHLSGTVVLNVNGKLSNLPGVTITIKAANGAGPTYTKVTDSSGYFGLGGLPNQAYKVTLQLPAGDVAASPGLTITTPALGSGQSDNSLNFTLKPIVVFDSSTRYVQDTYGVDPTIYTGKVKPASAPEYASGTSAFNGSVSDDFKTGDFQYLGSTNFIEVGASATQNSTLTASAITDSGKVAGLEDDQEGGGSSFGEGRSYFLVTFTLDAAVHFSLTGSYTDLSNTPTQAATLSFVGPGNAQVIPTQNGASLSPFSVNKSGVLAAGTYTIKFNVYANDFAFNAPVAGYALDLKLG